MELFIFGLWVALLFYAPGVAVIVALFVFLNGRKR